MTRRKPSPPSPPEPDVKPYKVPAPEGPGHLRAREEAFLKRRRRTPPG
jgi:hypothetical protein